MPLIEVCHRQTFLSGILPADTGFVPQRGGICVHYMLSVIILPIYRLSFPKYIA